MSHLEKLDKEDMGDSGSASAATGETVAIEPAAERRALSRFDWFVMPQMAILVLFAYLDRTNIGMSS